MRSRRLLPVVGVSAIALAVAAAFAPMANARTTQIKPYHHGVAHFSTSPAKRGNCYSNLHGDSGVAISSQYSASDPYGENDAGADNFSTKKTCNATGVYVVGQYYNGVGPAESETVTFYTDNNGKPGDVINSQTVTGADNGTGTFLIPLQTVALPPGPKWVSVVVNMDINTLGQWGWELTNHVKQGITGQWENPANGFGTGCTTWTDVGTCTGYSGDFMITVLKG